MAGSDDNAAAGFLEKYGSFYRRSSTQSEVYHTTPDALKRGYYEVAHHLARNAPVATYYNFLVVPLRRYPGSVSCSKPDDVNRREPFARLPAYSASYAGNRFDQCHKYQLKLT